MMAQSVALKVDDDVDDVGKVFQAMRTMAQDSLEYRRLRDSVVERYLPLAERIARRYGRRGVELDDLIQVARLGLLGAVDRFDVTLGAPFIGFAVPTITGEVRRHFRDHSWAMRVPRRLRDLHVVVGNSTAVMAQTLGRAPTASELATKLGVEKNEIVECLIASESYALASLDRVMPDQDGRTRTYADILGADDARLEHITNREALKPLLAGLTAEQREVLRLRFFESMTQSQIAARIGVSQMQVSRILAQTLQSLRDQLD